MSLLDKASLIVTPNSYKESKLYSVVPNTTLGDMDVVRGTTATRVNSAGLIESVGVNIPRIDYTNGSCPSILVEPQRTNLMLRSEDIDNASWSKINSSVTANTAVSPSGILNADKAILNIGVNPLATDATGLSQIQTITSGVYTYSIFAKAGERNIIRWRDGGFSGNYLVVNLINGTFTNGEPTRFVNPKVIPYNNGWYRISFTTGTITNPSVYPLRFGDVGQTGDGVSGGFVWGAQLELGAYGTSYIPTVASTVTRNADVISKTGISSLIGQTEGTIFTEFNFTNVGTEKYIVNLKDVASSNVISFRRLTSGEIRFVLTATTSSGTTNQSTAVLPNGNYKIAYKYISGSIKIFINGSLLFTLTPTFTFGSAISIIELGNQGTSSQINDSIKQLQLYKTALTDTECIALTTL